MALKWDIMTAYFTIFFLHFLIELFDFETDKGFVHGDVDVNTKQNPHCLPILE